MKIRLVAILALAAIGASAPPAAAVEVSVDGKVARFCDTGLLGGSSGVATRRFTAPKEGFLRVRLDARGPDDWDLALYDALNGNLAAGSVGLSRTELAGTWLKPGQTAIIQVCHRSGARSNVRFRREFVAVKRPVATEPAMLVDVETPRGPADVARFEQLGLDVTEHGDHDSFTVILHSSAERERLERAGFDYRVEVADLLAQDRRDRLADARYAARVQRSGIPSGRTGYRQYSDYQRDLKQLAEQNPTLVRAIQLPGSSIDGRPLEGVEIAPNVTASDGRPVFFMMGLHHAREWPSGENSMEFALDLVQSYKGGDARITALLDKLRVVVVPVANPDGYISTRQFDDSPANLQTDPFMLGPSAAPPAGAASYRRKNCRDNPGDPVPANAPCELRMGVDTNRNYGAFWGGNGASGDWTSLTFRGPGPFSEPETQSVRQALLKLPITNLITNHTYTGLILRPPGLNPGPGLPPSPDEPAMKRLGDAMGAATGYTSQYGYQLYDTSGTTDDWVYSALSSYSYTPEIGKHGFHPAYEEGVVKEYEGRGTLQGKGLREAYLLAAEAAADPQHHSLLLGSAPAGRVLRVTRDFATQTCGFPDMPPRVPCQAGVTPELQPEHRELTMTVPASGRFEWHVPPSARPYETEPEPWRLTCEDGAGNVLEAREVYVERSQRLSLALRCGA